jgi:hypothetical protein
MTDTGTPLPVADLPGTIRRYLRAHNAHDAQAATAELTPEATVTDEGRTYRGVPAVAEWLTRAASAYTYTTALVGAAYDGPDRYTVVQHLEGDFPGGTVDLRFHFTLDQDRIADLVIAP